MGITTICTHVLVEYSLCPFQYCLLDIPKLDGDNKDLEENNVEMEEDNSLTNRKRKYQFVKRHETTDIDQRSKHSVSIPFLHISIWSPSNMGITTICTHVLVEYSLCPFQYCLLPYP
jgi:hypothetical protein